MTGDSLPATSTLENKKKVNTEEFLKAIEQSALQHLSDFKVKGA